MVSNGNGKNGRPKIEIDWKDFEKLCLIQCSIAEVCQFFHISHQTLERRCREHYGETFGQVFEKKRVGGLISLRHSMLKMSDKHPSMAIFLAKNWLGMKESVEHTGEGGQPIRHTIEVVDSETKKELAKFLNE